VQRHLHVGKARPVCPQQRRQRLIRRRADEAQRQPPDLAARRPPRRLGRPEDVAAAALYLASPEAFFVTGEVLNVNGGWLFGR